MNKLLTIYANLFQLFYLTLAGRTLLIVKGATCLHIFKCQKLLGKIMDRRKIICIHQDIAADFKREICFAVGMAAANKADCD